jgi:hypothetical protein
MLAFCSLYSVVGEECPGPPYHQGMLHGAYAGDNRMRLGLQIANGARVMHGRARHRER